VLYKMHYITYKSCEECGKRIPIDRIIIKSTADGNCYYCRMCIDYIDYIIYIHYINLKTDINSLYVLYYIYIIKQYIL